MTAKEKRKLRMDVRHAVGVSSDPLPDSLRLLRAANALAGLFAVTSGRYRLTLTDRIEGREVRFYEAISRENAGRVAA